MTRFARLALILPLATMACGPTAQRTAPGGIRPPSVTPERIVAPSVPTLEGMPVAVRIGLTVHISGMVPVDSAGRIVGSDLEGQTRQALRNLVTVVRAARGLPGDVVRMTIYLRHPTPENVEVVRRIVLAELGTESPPALSIVGLSGLPEPSILVLIEGTAQLRSEFPDRERTKN